MRPLTLELFLGCFYGCAVGDALGAPLTLEGAGADLPDDPAALTYTRMLGYPLGQFTDDTQMTLALARGITAAGDVTGADMARSLRELWHTGDVLDPRPVCTEAIARLGDDGAGWEHSGTASPVTDLSSASRVGPIALWRAANTRGLIDDVQACSYITHADELACGAAVAVARATAYLATHEEFMVERCLYRIETAAARVAPEFGEWIPLIGEAIEEDLSDARVHLAPENADAGIVTVLWALYSALRTPDDFLTAVHTALSIGQDTDVAGAITGSIVGAHRGIDGLPAALTATLWNGAEVRETGEALAARYTAIVGEEIQDS